MKKSEIRNMIIEEMRAMNERSVVLPKDIKGKELRVGSKILTIYDMALVEAEVIEILAGKFRVKLVGPNFYLTMDSDKAKSKTYRL